jgi:hypothetical protein
MPSTSAKQARFMKAVANNPKFAKETGVPQSVGQEFAEADKAKTVAPVRADLQGINRPKTDHGKLALFNKGGMMKSDMKEDMAMDKKQDVAMIKKAIGQHDKQLHGGKKTKLALKGGGYVKAADGIAQRGKTRGTIC